ncbi:MAG: molybdenum cofactor guanylyltransferase [Piscirickettsiaceae bacterium]|nr:MAG: molybdenum cofactor guanylyltransferase [Piscirickettsiaceae bacterium]
MTCENKSIAALVLAGGLSRRMQGQDKGLLPLSGKPMVQYALEKLAFITNDILISTNNNIEEYQQFGFPLVSDILTGNLGPLAGIHAGLSTTSATRLLISACDCPLLKIGLYQRLIERMNETNASIVMATDGHRPQTTFVIIETSLTNSLANYLTGGGRRLITWYENENFVSVDCSDFNQSFININTHADIESASHLLEI